MSTVKDLMDWVEASLGRKPVSVEEINTLLNFYVDKPAGGLVLTKVGTDSNGEDMFSVVRADQ